LCFCQTRATRYQLLRVTTTTQGRQSHRGLLTFYQSGLRRRSFSTWHHGFGLREGADSSTASVGFSSAVAALGSSPSQERSVDFLYSTHGVVSQAQLLNSM
jgi:hypothetical protein